MRERRVGLEVFLTDPDVPIDTNHIERALRVIPMGRKSWLFCWTELGAKHVGIIQSLIVTCRLHGIDPYTYLVDVLQRVGEHPASRVAELTPRLWKAALRRQPACALTSRISRRVESHIRVACVARNSRRQYGGSKENGTQNLRSAC